MGGFQEEATIQQASGELGQESIGGIERTNQKPQDCQGGAHVGAKDQATAETMVHRSQCHQKNHFQLQP